VKQAGGTVAARMDGWKIRPARRGDGAGMASLHLAGGHDYLELDPTRFRMPDEDGLAEWLNGDLQTSGGSWICFVAEEDGRIVGQVEAKLLQPMETARYQVITALGQVRGEVSSLGVLKSHRRRGIGRALMQQAERWLADRGATVIELDTLATSPESVPFYEAIGYERRSIIFERRL
jgi:ribosomal protein S18 acetylase RimI-like enzyme